MSTTRSGSNDYVQITASDGGLPPLFLKLVEYLLERVSVATTTDEGIDARSIDASSGRGEVDFLNRWSEARSLNSCFYARSSRRA